MRTHIHYIIVSFLFIYSFQGVDAQRNMEIRERDRQRISFEWINNLIVIPVRVNDVQLNFILDTGATKTVLFGILNEPLLLKESEKIRLRGLGSGEPIEGIVSKNNTIKIKNIHGWHQTIYVVPNDQFDMSAKMGKTIHGIIGYELLKNFVTTINYTNRRIEFYKPSKYKPPKSKKYQEIPFHFHRNKPYVTADVSIDSVSVYTAKLLIDSGNSDALWLFEDEKIGLVTPDEYFDDYIGEGLSGKIHGKRGKIHSFRLKTFTFRRPTTAFLDSVAASYARSYKERNGSIGSRILSRFKVILDYPNRKMYLKKTKRFDKDFRYNRAGIELMHIGKVLVMDKQMQNHPFNYRDDNENNTVRFDINYRYYFKPLYGIYNVRSGSPADMTGLKANDIIHSINGKPTYNYTLQELTQFFYGDVGEIIKMVIERNGKQFHYEFQLKKLL